MAATGSARFFIEDIYPNVDQGRFPIKRIAGESVEVWADILRDGHDQLAADLLWRAEGAAEWQRARMQLHSNDRWLGGFIPLEPGRYSYAVEAWTDAFATWRRAVMLKRDAGQDVLDEISDGLALLVAISTRDKADASLLTKARKAAEGGALEVLLSEEVRAVATKIRGEDATRSAALPLVVDRPRARAGAWYEIMPRSQGRVPGKHGTFDDCIARLPDIAGLGFDVLYLTPIHPIGRAHRKGRNNALKAEAGDPGSPYAIGAEEGGHDAIHPELGTLEDFRRLVAACAEHGMEIALDFATQCSPDHPWVKQHPEWFKRRADGSIRYAENPPKKYEDIVNPDFYAPEAYAVWQAFRDVILFWVAQGVRIFRVDNPHTKPFPFWEWLIREVQAEDPDVLFLAEAFTRPKVMKALAKLGFSQSYTYFTWRTGKDEIQAYLSEITGYPEREYFRPNFFANTPDILPYHLQGGERWMFEGRAALAATLSGNYGIYSGFELLEHEPIPGREEYLHSEKYEVKVRDWSAEPNIRGYLRRLNRIRRENPALLQTSNLRFLSVDDGEVTGFVKEAADFSNAIAVVIALAAGRREFWVHFGDLEIGPANARRRVRELENLSSGERVRLDWGGVRLAIDTGRDPALIFRCIV